MRNTCSKYKYSTTLVSHQFLGLQTYIYIAVRQAITAMFATYLTQMMHQQWSSEMKLI
jgi:hypothetical protein